MISFICKFNRWPRGRYNGKRIIGFSVKVKVTLDWWGWLPSLPNRWGKAFVWGFLMVWFETEYEWKEGR